MVKKEDLDDNEKRQIEEAKRLADGLYDARESITKKEGLKATQNADMALVLVLLQNLNTQLMVLTKAMVSKKLVTENELNKILEQQLKDNDKHKEFMVKLNKGQ